MLIFSFDYPPNDGGIARLCSAIAEGLALRGIPVKVLSQEFTGETPKIDHIVDTVRVTKKRPLREIYAIRELLRSQNTTCISGIWYPDGLLAHFCGFEKHIILALGAELYPPRSVWRQRFWKYLQKYTLEHASVVIAISQFTHDLVKKNAPKANVIILPLAVDHKQFSPQDRTTARKRWDIDNNKLVVSTVSRVQRFKGHETVMEALASLPKHIQEQFIYLVGGKGSDLEFLKGKANELGIAQQIRWLGFVDEGDLPSLYSASDLFVLATREIPNNRSVEGFGLVFLEAQACGTPVVGTNTGGIPDAVSHGDGGWLIKQDDVQDLSRIFTELYNKPNDFHEMGIKARARVEREFTWEHYLDRFIGKLTEEGIQFDG